MSKKERGFPAKPDHPRILWVCFVRKTPKAVPELATVSQAALNALVIQKNFAEKLNLPLRKIELVAYHASCERERLAQKIATAAALERVDSCSLEVERDGEKWRDLSDLEFDYLVECEDELCYLELAGRLRRHPSEPTLVQFIEGA
jgi:hypothetical protein